MRLRRAKGEAPSVLIAGSLAIGSSLLGGAFAVSYWPTRSGAALRRCSGAGVGGQRTLGRVFGIRAAFTVRGRGRWHSADLAWQAIPSAARAGLHCARLLRLEAASYDCWAALKGCRSRF